VCVFCTCDDCVHIHELILTVLKGYATRVSIWKGSARRALAL